MCQTVKKVARVIFFILTFLFTLLERTKYGVQAICFGKGVQLYSTGRFSGVSCKNVVKVTNLSLEESFILSTKVDVRVGTKDEVILELMQLLRRILAASVIEQFEH